MTKQQICPRCRSVIQLNGQINFSAPALQSLDCPVCGQGWWLSSDFPLPKRWSIGKIITAYDTKSKPVLSNQQIPEDLQKSVYSDFQIIPDSITNAVKNTVDNVTGSVKAIGIWIVVVLVLVLLIKRKK
jgi:ribosomal protein S27AE